MNRPTQSTECGSGKRLTRDDLARAFAELAELDELRALAAAADYFLERVR